MRTKHTPGPATIKTTNWSGDHVIVGSDGHDLCAIARQLLDGSGGHKETGGVIRTPEVHAENARRLAACWNACEGIDTEYLEGDDSLPHFARRLMMQRDELLEACKSAEKWLEGWASAEPYLSIIRAALGEKA